MAELTCDETSGEFYVKLMTKEFCEKEIPPFLSELIRFMNALKHHHLFGSS